MTITGRDGLQGEVVTLLSLRPEDKHASLAEASSWGCRKLEERCVQIFPGEKSAHLDCNSTVQPESLGNVCPWIKSARGNHLHSVGNPSYMLLRIMLHSGCPQALEFKSQLLTKWLRP